MSTLNEKSLEWTELSPFLSHATRRDVALSVAEWVGRFLLEAAIDMGLLGAASLIADSVQTRHLQLPGWMLYLIPAVIALSIAGRSKLELLVRGIRYRRWISAILLLFVVFQIRWWLAFALIAAPQALDCVVSAGYTMAYRGRRNYMRTLSPVDKI